MVIRARLLLLIIIFLQTQIPLAIVDAGGQYKVKTVVNQPIVVRLDLEVWWFNWEKGNVMS